MKKFLSLVLALIMTMSLVTVSAGAKDFTDGDKVTYDEAVSVMSEVKVLDGYADGSFNPQAGLTRGAAAKIICNLILGPTTAAELNADTAPYKDVPVDSTFAGYIAYCAKEGIISGYADGTFRPAAPLTGYAFMKMLLGALGYDQYTEGYTGANWSINVAKQAIGIGLNAGLMTDFNGSKAVNREEAALYAFNTLKSTMVEYTEKTTVSVGGAEVVLQGTAKEVEWGTAKLNDGNIKPDGFVQFAEKHFPKLEKRDTVDAFDRPAYTWVNNKDEIGTFVDWSKMVGEYTVAIDGKELSELLGKSVIAKSDVEYFVDGRVNDTIKASNMIKTNTSNYATTGKGVLTQVFLDTDAELITITSINTFAAKVTSDYNTKKETLNINIQDGIKNVGAYNYTSETLSSEDFDGLDEFEDGDVVLVTVAETTKDHKYTVQSIVMAESLTEKDVTKFSEESYLVTDGEQYDYAKLGYIWNELGLYYGERLDNTYNIYFDAYGYVIATEVAEAESKYLFMTGYDLGGSYLATKNADAFVIFTDGTTANIKVNVIDTNDNIGGNNPHYVQLGKTVGGGDNQYNRWFKYSVDKNDVYTLTPVANYSFMYADAAEQKINVNNVRIIDQASGKCAVTDKNQKISYGNDDSVFITVKTGDVSLAENADLLGITKVTGTYTGVQNVDLKIFNTTDNKLSVDIAGQNEPAVFVLYDEDLYIIAAIVVGEDNTTTDSYAYAIKSAKNEYKADGYYYWDFDAIVDGKIVTLTVKEKGTTVLRDKIAKSIELTSYSMFKLTYDKDGYVVGADLIDNAAEGDAEKLYDAADFNKAGGTIIDGSKFKVYDVYHQSPADLYAIGRTLYVNNKADRDVGLTIAADAPVVVIEKYTTGTKIEEYDTIKQALDALDHSNAFKGHIAAALNSNGTAKYLVLKSTDVVNVETDNGATKVDDSVKTLYAYGQQNSIKFNVDLKAAATQETEVSVTVKVLNGGTWVPVDTYAVTVAQGATQGTAVTVSGLLAGQYKVECGNLPAQTIVVTAAALG